MLDLSNNNVNHNLPDPYAHFHFGQAYKAGQRRVYLKVSQGTHFTDRDAHALSLKARRAGFRVGGYHFADDFTQSGKDQADAFLGKLLVTLGKPKAGDCLPVLDLEIGTPSRTLGLWAISFIARVKEKIGVSPIIYSYASFLQACQFKVPPAHLWLAAYGKNDGVEHNFYIPKPWTTLVAHQYTSRGKVPGIPGLVDVSHLGYPTDVDVP